MNPSSNPLPLSHAGILQKPSDVRMHQEHELEKQMLLTDAFISTAWLGCVCVWGDAGLADQGMHNA